MQRRLRKKKADLNELASLVVDQATNEAPPESGAKPEDGDKNPAAVLLGKLGGSKGGKARAKNMTKKERSEAARKAALSRWKKK
jgi:hypothetical protein